MWSEGQTLQHVVSAVMSGFAPFSLSLQLLKAFEGCKWTTIFDSRASVAKHANKYGKMSTAAGFSSATGRDGKRLRHGTCVAPNAADMGVLNSVLSFARNAF